MPIDERTMILAEMDTQERPLFEEAWTNFYKNGLGFVNLDPKMFERYSDPESVLFGGYVNSEIGSYWTGWIMCAQFRAGIGWNTTASNNGEKPR